MLKVAVIYTDKAGRQMPIVESLDGGTVQATARRILKEYEQGVLRCKDPVLAALIQNEVAQAKNVLQVAGVGVTPCNEKQ